VADDLRYAATVRAAEVSYPRGGRWTLPALFLAVFVWNAWSFDFSWPIVVVWALVAVSAGFNSWKLSRRGYRLFEVMAAGIVFGLDPTRKVPCRDVEELRISAMRCGALLEIVLTPSAAVAYRSLLRQAADVPLAPFWLPRRLRGLPALALPRRNPPRYLIPLLEVTPAELRSELARLLPGIPIVMIWT
jgi:hypothetical protein